jgi:mobilome CxxCx(11)CxxC protein
LSATTTVPPDQRFIECRNRCTYAFATAAIFQNRARKYTKYLQRLTFLGLALPVSIGGVVGADLAGGGTLKEFIWIAGFVGVVQLIVTLWSVVADWPGKLESSLSASGENSRLADEFDALAKTFNNPPLNFDILFEKLKAQDGAQNIADKRQLITKEEEIYGHRAALYQFRIACAVCKNVPNSREIPGTVTTRCETCGGN